MKFWSQGFQKSDQERTDRHTQIHKALPSTSAGSNEDADCTTVTYEY